MLRDRGELVRRVQQPAPEADLAAFFRDAAAWEAARRGLRSVFAADCVCAVVMPGQGGAAEQRTYLGIDGLRGAWLDWLQPWASYHVRIERLVEAGEQVLVLRRDLGRRHDMDKEISSPVAAIWTIRDGKIVRAEFYANRQQALEAVGLRDSEPHIS
jgi:ketosteroid isomerase-like protein